MMPMSHSEEDCSNLQMHSNITLLRNHINSITKYLSPLLLLANCHMVEFITKNHWNLLPEPLKYYLENQECDSAVEEFWQCHTNNNSLEGKSVLSNWVKEARSHYAKVNNRYCLSSDQLQDRMTAWGGSIKHELLVTEFMTQKKSYEVQTMSQLVASLFDVTSATCSVEAGGGRGHLQVALCLGYNIPSLTIDCNTQAVQAAEKRVNMIKKQWHVIAKRTDGGTESRIPLAGSTLHRFAAAFINRDSDLAETVRTHFPDHRDTRLLLTGLHTCGDLGPVSLRLFERHVSTAAVFNVPCCYHLLNEDPRGDEGFPMSRCLAGYELGRNARMLANHSIERMAAQRDLPAKSLLYRAMLEVIIKTYKPGFNLATGKLKRISSKAECFEQYFKMADHALSLGVYDTLPTSYLQEIIENGENHWKKLVLFYLMKLCLAQVVETLILLDRIMYLYESNFEKVYLVKLFDPVLSPRCHSIVAIRN